MDKKHFFQDMPRQSIPWWRKGDSHAALDTKLVTSLSPRKIPTLKQLKYLPKLISKKEYRILQILLAIVAVNVLFLGWRFYERATVLVAREGGRYVEGLVGSPRAVNPLLLQENDSDRDITRLVYSGLSAYGHDRKIVPDVAERYELSGDQKTYTFYLRQNATWHDGKPLTADDVVFTITRIQNPEIKSPLYSSFKDVRVERVDDHAVRFILSKPFAPFLDLTTVGILPKHAWETIQPEAFALAALNIKPVGSGPWKFKTFQKDKDGTIRSYTLERNKAFYGNSPLLDRIMFKFYPDSDSALQALKNHNVDGISFLPRELRVSLSKNTDFHYYTFHLPQYTALFFNEFNNPDLKSKAVRQALAYALDKDALVRDVLAGEGRVIHAPILEGFLGYAPEVKKYPFDLSRMADLLTTAGWEKDGGGRWVKNETIAPPKPSKKKKKNAAPVPPPTPKPPHQLHVTIVTVNQPEQEKLAMAVKDQWMRAGVESEVQLVDPTRLKTDVINGRNYEIFAYGEIIGSDPDLYPFWHSSQAHAPGLNLSLYSNSQADTYLAQAREITDEKSRAEKYIAFQNILADDVPAIFLYNPSYNYVVSAKVKGITDQKQIAYPSDRFLDINSWYIKAKRVWRK